MQDGISLWLWLAMFLFSFSYMSQVCVCVCIHTLIYKYMHVYWYCSYISSWPSCGCFCLSLSLSLLLLLPVCLTVSWNFWVHLCLLLPAVLSLCILRPQLFKQGVDLCIHWWWWGHLGSHLLLTSHSLQGGCFSRQRMWVKSELSFPCFFIVGEGSRGLPC